MPELTEKEQEAREREDYPTEFATIKRIDRIVKREINRAIARRHALFRHREEAEEEED